MHLVAVPAYETDTTPPTVKGLVLKRQDPVTGQVTSFDPSDELETYNQAFIVIFEIDVEDDASGIDSVSVRTTGHGGSDRSRGISEVYEPFAITTQTHRRILRAQYRIKKTIPALSANGKWEINYIEVADTQGNVRRVNGAQVFALTGRLHMFDVKASTCENTPYHCQDISTYFNVAANGVRHNANYAYQYYGYLSQLEGQSYFSMATADQYPNTDSGLGKVENPSRGYVYINNPKTTDNNVQ